MDKFARHSNLQRQKVALGHGPQCICDLLEQDRAEAVSRPLDTSDSEFLQVTGTWACRMAFVSLFSHVGQSNLYLKGSY